MNSRLAKVPRRRHRDEHQCCDALGYDGDRPVVAFELSALDERRRAAATRSMKRRLDGAALAPGARESPKLTLRQIRRLGPKVPSGSAR